MSPTMMYLNMYEYCEDEDIFLRRFEQLCKTKIHIEKIKHVKRGADDGNDASSSFRGWASVKNRTYENGASKTGSRFRVGKYSDVLLTRIRRTTAKEVEGPDGQGTRRGRVRRKAIGRARSKFDVAPDVADDTAYANVLRRILPDDGEAQ